MLHGRNHNLLIQTRDELSRQVGHGDFGRYSWQTQTRSYQENTDDTPCVCPLHINQHPVNGHYFEIRVGGLAVFILVGYIKHNEHTHIKIICVEGSENLICGLQTATFCNKISDLR